MNGPRPYASPERGAVLAGVASVPLSRRLPPPLPQLRGALPSGDMEAPLRRGTSLDLAGAGLIPRPGPFWGII